MEPNVIDYYNEEPYMIKIIEKMDKEYEELQEEYTKLKERQTKLEEKYKTPHKIYNNHNEWLIDRDKSYLDIRKCVDEYIVHDEFEYDYMDMFGGLTPRQRMYIAGGIETALTELTGNNVWSENVSHKIVYGINSFLNGMKGMDHPGIWGEFMMQMHPQNLSDIIYHSIVWQLDTGEHSPCILDTFPLYRCIRCKTILYPGVECEIVDEEDEENEEWICSECSKNDLTT